MVAQVPAKAALPNRWLQLSVGVACMVMIANLQYGWTYFVNPMKESNNWALAAIQVAFSLFVLTETWLIQSRAGLWTNSDQRPSLWVAVWSRALAGVGTASRRRF